MAPFGAAPAPASAAHARYLPLQHFFLTIATTLGTGILALPVKLSTSGLGPLALTLTAVLAGQLGAALMMVELIQRASLSVGTDTPVTLHLLSVLYLRPGDGLLFTSSVLVHLVSILVSYLLAGSLSLGTLLGLAPAAHAWLLAPYALTLTACLLTFSTTLSRVVSLLTAGKLTLILVMIGVTASLVGQTGAHPDSDWALPSILHPFLIATVALGGVVNLMPLMAAQVPLPAAWHGRGAPLPGRGRHDPVAAAQEQYKAGMRTFGASVCAGLVFCWGMNLVWAALVLSIVPQSMADAVGAGLPPALSLEAAAQAGHISTVPLVALIRLQHPGYAWVATSVSIFISLSISLSYLVMGAGLKHLVDGVCAHWGDGRGGGGAGRASRLATRDPHPLLLRPAHTSSMHTSVGASLRGARPEGWAALSVKDGGGRGGEAGLELAPLPPPSREVRDGDALLALPGARSLAAHVAAASVLSRLADEEARLSLYLDDVEEGEEKDGEEGRCRTGAPPDDGVDTTTTTGGGEGGLGRGGHPSSAPPARTGWAGGLEAAIAWWDRALSNAGRVLLLPLLPALLLWRCGQGCAARRAPWLVKEGALRRGLYVASFGTCYAVAQSQPAGFLSALEIFTSLALNLSCGYYVASMFVNARRLHAGLPLMPPLLEWRVGVAGEEGKGEDPWAPGAPVVLGEKEGLLAHEVAGPGGEGGPAPSTAATPGLDACAVEGEGGEGEEEVTLRDGDGQEGGKTVHARTQVGRVASGGPPPPPPPDDTARATEGRPELPSPSTPAWTLSTPAALRLPQAAWLIFGTAIAYDVVESVAWVSGWSSALPTSCLAALLLQHKGCAAALREGLLKAGVLPAALPPIPGAAEGGGGGKRAGVGPPDGRLTVALCALALACAGAQRTSHPHDPSTIPFPLTVALPLLVAATGLLGAAAGGVRPALSLAALGQSMCTALAWAVTLSLPPRGGAWQGCAAAAAWAAAGAQAVEAARAAVLVLRV